MSRRIFGVNPSANGRTGIAFQKSYDPIRKLSEGSLSKFSDTRTYFQPAAVTTTCTYKHQIDTKGSLPNGYNIGRRWSICRKRYLGSYTVLDRRP